jgi:hemolysin III
VAAVLRGHQPAPPDHSGEAAEAELPVPKPRLRGVLHEWCFYAAVPLGIVFGLFAETTRGQTAAAVFAATVAGMFGASALYHRVSWSPTLRPWLRRLDHAGIFGLIAGTYTPFGLLVLHGAWRISVLAVVWGGCLAAILMRFVWVSAPKWLAAIIGLALGWVGVLVFPQILEQTGLTASMLVLAGGLCYTIGTVVYTLGKPDPRPAFFGYHELFHVFVSAAVCCQYAAVAFFVVPR